MLIFLYFLNVSLSSPHFSFAVDFSNSGTQFNRTITVSRVANLTLVLSNGTKLENTTTEFSSMSVPCPNNSNIPSVCYEIDIQSGTQGEFNVVLPSMKFVLKIIVDDRCECITLLHIHSCKCSYKHVRHTLCTYTL